MSNIKQNIAVVCCGLTLSLTPEISKAIPITDLIEDYVPLPTEMVQTATSLTNAKNQMTQLQEGLSAMGGNAVNTFDMGENLRAEDDEADEAANHVSETIKYALDTNIKAQSILDEASVAVDNAQQNIADSLVKKVEADMKLASNTMPHNIYMAQNDVTLFLEEEEEESVASSVDKNKMDALFDNVKKESKQLNNELNDTFDDTLNIMNQVADINHKSLTALEKFLKSAKEADADKLAELRVRVNDLIKREQLLSDRSLQAIENNKNQHNKDYQENVADGISNYQKIVQAYINGDVSKDEVLNAGAKLKQAVANSKAATNVSDGYKNDIAAIQEETLALAKEVKGLYNTEELDS